MDRAPLTVRPAELVAELGELVERFALADDAARPVLTFDADGTLWSGDVGEDLFSLALEKRVLRADATPALLNEAARFGIEVPDREPNGIARALFSAYLAGRYPERETCEMMAYCYAGAEEHEVEALAQETLERSGLASRLQQELAPIIEFSRARALRSVVISASPVAVVRAGAALWGFVAEDVCAATPAVHAGRIQAKLARALPYAKDKVAAGRALFGPAPWLAAFGDNVFDIDMLAAAEHGIAVRPKPKLRARLLELGLRILEP